MHTKTRGGYSEDTQIRAGDNGRFRDGRPTAGCKATASNLTPRNWNLPGRRARSRRSERLAAAYFHPMRLEHNGSCALAEGAFCARIAGTAAHPVTRPLLRGRAARECARTGGVAAGLEPSFLLPRDLRLWAAPGPL